MISLITGSVIAVYTRTECSNDVTVDTIISK